MVRKAVLIAITSLFGGIHAILVAIPGVWRSFMILIMPLEGIILGPTAGFTAALIGAIIGRVLRPRPGLLPIFGFGEAIGALTTGLMFKGAWKHVLTLYLAMLSIYFIHPLGSVLPAWALWDVYIALALTLITPHFTKKVLKEGVDPRRLMLCLALTSFIGVEADVLTRIFLFIPMGLYKMMGIPEEALPLIWIAGAVETPIESLISVIATVTVGTPLLIAIEKGKVIKWPLT